MGGFFIAVVSAFAILVNEVPKFPVPNAFGCLKLTSPPPSGGGFLLSSLPLQLSLLGMNSEPDFPADVPNSPCRYDENHESEGVEDQRIHRLLRPNEPESFPELTFALRCPLPSGAIDFWNSARHPIIVKDCQLSLQFFHRSRLVVIRTRSQRVGRSDVIWIIGSRHNDSWNDRPLGG